MKNKPSLTVVINFFNNRREAARTLYSLSSEYQNDVSATQYEVIAIDNGSTEALSTAYVSQFGENFHYRFYDTTAVSPVNSVNDAIEQTSTEHIMVMIDGAHIITPGIVGSALKLLPLFARPFIATVSFHLGPQIQNKSMLNGYNQHVEDRLLLTKDWKNDGYDLFLITGSFANGSPGWFGTLAECSCFATTKAIYQEAGGYDERFKSPGGGLVAHDYFSALPLIEWVDYLMADERQRLIRADSGYQAPLEGVRC